MAEKQETQGELSCTVCLGGFREPKVLPCCHSFCLQCLEGALEKSQDHKNITCPQCRTQHQVPANGVRGFLNDYTVTCSQEPLSIAAAGPVICEQCDKGKKVVTYCNICHHICGECAALHKHLKIFRSHELLSRETAVVMKDEEEVTSKKVYPCTIHPQELLEVYCKTCQTLTCVRCFMSEHNRHNYGEIDSKLRMEAETLINKVVDTTDSKLKKFTENLKYIEKVEKEKTEGVDLLKAQISKKVDELIAQLEVRRTKLLKQVDDMFSKDLKELWAEKEYHETAIVNMKDALSFARRTLRCQEDTEVLVLRSQVTNRLTLLSQLTWDSRPTEKIETRQWKWKPDSMSSINVGKLEKRVSTPAIQIKTDKFNKKKADESTSFRCIATVNIPTERSHTMLHSNIVLSGSAVCRGIRRRSDHQWTEEKFTENVPVIVCKCTLREWRVSFTPILGTTDIGDITLTARGQYGGSEIKGTVIV